MSRKSLKIKTIKNINGEVNIAGRDIIKNIKTIYQRAFTAAEEAARARELESELLARGVAELAQSLSTQVREGVESWHPYKGLLSYNLNESEIFYGRSKARKDLLNCIKQGPLTVLHSESGAGKTSLLQAGIAAQLIASGHLAVYLRPHNAYPADFIKRMFLPELTQAPKLAQASLREYLRRICIVLGTKTNLYLLLDQFEEFFKLLKKEERRTFLESLADCINDPSLRVHWILSLRAEALSALTELEAFGVTPFKNHYRLTCLNRTEAEEAMIEPAKLYGITFERALIDYILDTLAPHDEIMPTQLQLVCSALTDDLPEGKILTLVYYTDHEGGTEGILRDYLKRQLAHLPMTEQTLAWKVLRVLITVDRQRAVKTRDEIYQELKTSIVSKKQVDTILGRLVERRLLFNLSVTVEIFELAHDYLIEAIKLDPHEQARKAAQELLDQEERAYQRHGTLLTTERLAVIEPYQNELHFSIDEEALFSKSKKAAQLEQSVRLRRRNTALVVSLLVATIMSLLAFWGFKSTQESRQQTNIALARQLSAQGQAINASHSSKQIIAVLLNIQSLKLFPTDSAANFLLNDESAARPIVQMTHNNIVKIVVFSPDGKYVASGSDDKTARVWEIVTGREVARMTHSDVIRSIAFSPDGKYVVSAGDDYDKTARVWEASTGTEVVRMTHDAGVCSVAFSPDGKYVVSGSFDFTTRVWESLTGREIARMGDEIACSVSFSPNGKYIASGSVQVWEALTGKKVVQMNPRNEVSSLAFSPDGRYIASGSIESAARVWEIATGREITRVMHNGGVVAFDLIVAFSPDSKYVVSGSYDGIARVWEALTGKEVARAIHDGEVHSVAFSPDGKYIVSGSTDGTAHVWEAITGNELAHMIHNGSVNSVAFSRDGKYVVSGSNDATVRVWQVAKSTELAHLLRGDTVPNVKFSPDSKYIVGSSSSKTISVWEVITGKEIVRMAQSKVITSLALSPDGKYIVAGGADGPTHVWETSTGKEVAHMPYDARMETAAFSPDGKYVVSASGNKMIRVWEITTGKEIAHIVSDDWVDLVAFSPDGKYVVTSSGYSDKAARVWEATTGKEVTRISPNTRANVVVSSLGKYVVSGGSIIQVLEAATGKEVTRMTHDDSVNSFALSPDGKYLVSGSDDKITRVWDVATGKEVTRMASDSQVNAVAVSLDGKHVVSGSSDGTARVWDALTGKAIARILNDGEVYSVAFSPDGKYVAVDSLDNDGDRTTQVWVWQVNDLITRSCAYISRNLTYAEWKQYIGDILPYQPICDNLPVEAQQTATP